MYIGKLTNINKKIALVIAVILTVVYVCCFDGTAVANASNEEGPSVSYTLSQESLKQGDIVEILFYFKDYSSYNITATSFQMDVVLDTKIFSLVSAETRLDTGNTTGAFMNITKLNTNDSKIKTVYFNTKNDGSHLPANTNEICSIKLKLEKDFGFETSKYTLPVSLVVLIDGTASPSINYTCVAQNPTMTLVGSSVGVSTPLPTNTPTPTEAPTETPTVEPTVAPTNAPSDVFHTVNYVDANGRTIYKENVKHGEAAKYDVKPYRPGYYFKGWISDDGELSDVQYDMTAISMYERGQAKYKVEVVGGTINDSQSKTESFYYDDCVIVSLNQAEIPENKVFLGWTTSDDYSIVSQSETYSFLVTRDVCVKAVFGTREDVLLPKINLNVSRVTLDETEYMCFEAERYCPTEFTYVTSGVILTKDSAVAESESAFALGNLSVTNYQTTQASANAKFTLSKFIESEDDIVYARAYIIYKDSAGTEHILYTDVDTML